MADDSQYQQRIRTKVLIKLGKVYTALYNHFKGRECLDQAKNLLKTDDFRMNLRYREAKCFYHSKLAVKIVLVKQVEKLRILLNTH